MVQDASNGRGHMCEHRRHIVPYPKFSGEAKATLNVKYTKTTGK